MVAAVAMFKVKPLTVGDEYQYPPIPVGFEVGCNWQALGVAVIGVAKLTSKLVPEEIVAVPARTGIGVGGVGSASHVPPPSQYFPPAAVPVQPTSVVDAGGNV
jgi:hypothetical protein